MRRRLEADEAGIVGGVVQGRSTMARPWKDGLHMPQIDDLADRVERLLIRYDELKRTNGLLQQQLATVTHERDSLRSRLNAARHRIDTLLERLPDAAPATAAATPASAADGGEGVLKA